MTSENWPAKLENATVAPQFSAVPGDVSIEITGRCQLACRHCYNESGPDNSDELSLRTIEVVLDNMVEWKVPWIRITGGEPTMHGQFRKIVEACRCRHIDVTVNSNGIFARDMLAYLQSAPIERFLISLDGMEKANDAIRGPGTFRQAISTCRDLRQSGQRVILCYHVGEMNRNDIAPLVSLAAEMSADVKISPIRPVGRAIATISDGILKPQQYLAVVRQLCQLRDRFPYIQIQTDFDILDGPFSDGNQDASARLSCKAGRVMVHIRSNGDILPCAFFVTPAREFVAGNIHHESIGRVWLESPVFEPFRRHQKSEACRSCQHYQGRCVGGCPAVAHFLTGRLDAHDPMCFANLIETTAGASDD